MRFISYDVVIIGGGISGSAAAAAVARDGHTALLLERDLTYRDKVRGEVINCWGVDELRTLGLEDVVLAAGGTWIDRFIGYDETVDPQTAQDRALDLGTMVPGVPGVLDVGHPESCAALSSAAERAGARVERGASNVRIDVDADPAEVSFVDSSGRTVHVRTRLVVGADGRQSTTRKQLGITLTETPPNSLGGGLLVDGLDQWPANVTSIGTEKDVMFFVYPRKTARARLYLLHAVADRGRFTGPGRQQAFLDAFQLDCIPHSDMFSRARASDACAFFPMSDSWTDRPYVERGVLIGDAAGWSDPVIGQGLSVAFSDARLVRDALRDNSDWRADIFKPYADERRLRMQRLRISGQVRSMIYMTFTEAGRRRRKAYAAAWPNDDVLAGSRLATFRGAFNVAPGSFDPETIDRIRQLR